MIISVFIKEKNTSEDTDTGTERYDDRGRSHRLNSQAMVLVLTL